MFFPHRLANHLRLLIIDPEDLFNFEVIQAYLNQITSAQALQKMHGKQRQ